jgi:hypothetical protein
VKTQGFKERQRADLLVTRTSVVWLNHEAGSAAVAVRVGIGADAHAANHAPSRLTHRAAYAASGCR